MKDPKELRKEWLPHYKRWSGEPESNYSFSAILGDTCNSKTSISCIFEASSCADCRARILAEQYRDATGPERTRLAREIRDLPLKEEYRKIFPYVKGDMVRVVSVSHYQPSSWIGITITIVKSLSRGRSRAFEGFIWHPQDLTPAQLVEEKEEPMFKIGDRVKYVSGKFFDSTPNPLWNGKHGKVTGTITGVYLGEADVDWDNGTNNGCYKEADLELIKEEPMAYYKTNWEAADHILEDEFNIKLEEPMKYKALKPITPATLWEAQFDKRCGEFQRNWDGMLDHFGCSSLIAQLPFAPFMEWAESRSGSLIDWLIGRGFIGIVEEERTFAVGQCFDTPHMGVHALASTSSDGGNRAVLTCGSSRYGDDFPVEDFHAIKPSEIPDFNQLKPVPGRFVYDPEAQ